MSLSIATNETGQRPAWPAILRGLKCRCPNCGKGKLFRSYLKVVDQCEECGEDLSGHRADDLPPYLAILIVGHLIVGIMLHMEMAMQVSALVYLAIMLPLALVLPLVILPSIKGAVVGLQWANRMHGFDPLHRDPALPDSE